MIIIACVLSIIGGFVGGISLGTLILKDCHHDKQYEKKKYRRK